MIRIQLNLDSEAEEKFPHSEMANNAVSSVGMTDCLIAGARKVWPEFGVPEIKKAAEKLPREKNSHFYLEGKLPNAVRRVKGFLDGVVVFDLRSYEVFGRGRLGLN